MPVGMVEEFVEGRRARNFHDEADPSDELRNIFGRAQITVQGRRDVKLSFLKESQQSSRNILGIYDRGVKCVRRLQR